MKVDLQCSLHPHYKAVNFPSSHCHACLTLYWLRRDGTRLMGDASNLKDKSWKNKNKNRKKS